MKRFNHPVVFIMIVVAVIIVIAMVLDTKEECAKQEVTKLALELKIEQAKIGESNSPESLLINKK